ncbi:polyphosphate--glucose phosphotransferase [Hyunsoonleella sp. 2307UL5-6]|uniref:polyphosphate--glucose phosphotransferase n=1 Tax=Hyunsoonleella sp. 2307UL5-6 TaxID=3384768 RepID=UPI0039BD20F3
MEVLGIDIGGSGMKGALVNLETGELTTERYRISTPASRKPEDMANVFKQIVEHFNYSGPIGCGFPTIIKHGVCKSVSNLNKAWINVNAEQLFSKASGNPVTVINDADAAGYAVMHYGIGKDEQGLVIMITVGTGIGSGAFFNGKLIPNFELGQIPYKKYKKIEHYTADSIRKKEDLSFKVWGKRLNTFLELVDTIVCPDLIILGGGVSKYYDQYEKHINIETSVKPAKLGNHAGIIGAAAAVLDKNSTKN